MGKKSIDNQPAARIPPSRKIVRRKQLSGAKKMKAYGKKAILLGVLPEQHERLKCAAAVELRPVSQFIIFHAMAAAEKALSPLKQ